MEFLWKEEFLEVIDSYGLGKEDFCIVGGTGLSLHGLRPNTDVDISVKSDVLKKTLYDNKKIESLQVVRNIIFTSEHTDIHVGRFQNIGIPDNELIENSELHRVIDGFKVCRVEVELVDRIFVKYPKRKKDVLLIKENYENIENWDWRLVIDLMLKRQEYIMNEELKSKNKQREKMLIKLMKKPWWIFKRVLNG